MTAYKTAGLIPVSREIWVDALPLATLFWPEGDRIAEYLRYQQSFHTGPATFNPAELAESFEWVGSWDDPGEMQHFDWPYPDDDW